MVKVCHPMAIMRHTADRGFPREGVDTFTHGFLPSVKGGKWDKQKIFIETPAKKMGWIKITIRETSVK